MKGDANDPYDQTEHEFREEVAEIVPIIAEAFVSGATELPRSYPKLLQRILPGAKMLR